jgi:hypothetical protein
MSDDASRVVVALIGDNSNIEATTATTARSFDRGMSLIENSARRAETEVVRSTGAIRFATRDLGFQISDIGTQLAGGQSPFLIFAQQGPQVANALSEISAAGAGLGTVLSGVALPALLAIASVIGVLYQKSQQAADGHKAHEKAAKSLEASIHDLDVALGKAVETTQEAAQASYNDAKAKFAEEVATRKTTIAILEKAKAERDAAKGVGGLGGGTGGANLPTVNAANRVDDLQAQLDKQNKALVEGARAVVNSAIPIVQQHVKEATDAVAAANGRYERSLASLNAEFRKTGDARAYNQSLEDITRTRDAAIEAANKHTRATHGHSEAEREAAREAREHERALEELQRTFDALTKALDPGQAALDTYRERLEDIDKLVRAGKFTPDRADDLRGRALDAFIDADQKQAGADYDTQRERVLGSYAKNPAFSSGHEFGDFKFDMRQNGRDISDALDDGPFGTKAYKQQEDNVKSLAKIYEDAFTGSTKNIGDALKRELLNAVATGLARLTISKLGGLFSGGGALGSIGSFLGFGRASGGYVAPGQTVRVNENAGGAEFLRMGSTGGEVIPLGSARAAAPGANINVTQHISVDGRNSVTPADFAAQIVTVANHYADQASASAARGAVRAAPGQIQRVQKLGPAS